MNGPADIFPLEKEGLRIRRMEPGDLEPMARLLGDPSVMRYMEPPFDRARTHAFLQKAGFGPNPLIYGAERNGAFLGYVICHSWGRDAVELGWVLLPEYWGQGLAGWLTDMLLDGLRDRYARAIIECVPENAASLRVALRHGFTYEGTEGCCRIYTRDISPSPLFCRDVAPE